MEYYTVFGLDILEGDDYVTDYKKEIVNHSNGYLSLFDGDGDGHKWNNHEDDMLSYSEKHPKVLFLLSGNGENQGDLWKKYFKNGKMQESRAVITYEEYDENKLN